MNLIGLRPERHQRLPRQRVQALVPEEEVLGFGGQTGPMMVDGGEMFFH